LTYRKNQRKIPTFTWHHRVIAQAENSLTATIPQPIADAVELRKGDYLEIRLEGNEIVMRKI